MQYISSLGLWVPEAAGPSCGFTLAVLCLAVLVAQVDTAVVNLATQAIGAHFRTGIAALQWVLDSYNLIYASLLLTGGLLADLFGRRRVFMLGASIFTAASLICAFASATSVLIAGRAFAGLGAALLIPASLAVIRVVWSDREERGRALGIWAACNGLALAIAPTLGGLLLSACGWRSIFLVVVPVGLAALVLAVPAIPESADPGHRHFDASGQVFGATLAALALAATEAHGTLYVAGAALGMALLALYLFIRVEKRQREAALVPLDMFRMPAFLGAIVATAGMTFGMYGVLFLLPLTWQSTELLGATGAGLALMPMALVFVVVSPFSGWLEKRVGSRAAAAGGVGLIGFGLLVIGLGRASTELMPAEAGLVLAGAGMGIATGPLMGLAMVASRPPALAPPAPSLTWPEWRAPP